MKLTEFKQKSAGSGDPAPGDGVEQVVGAASSTVPLSGQITIDEAIEEAENEEIQSVTSVTPSGIEVLYSWAPRRHYKLRSGEGFDKKTSLWVGAEDWQEVPSVTTVLGVLDKSGPLTWWGQGVGAEGVLELHRQEAVDWDNDPVKVLVDTNRPKLPPTYEWVEASRQNLSSALVDRGISVNHVKDSAADRGVNIHDALESWCEDGSLPALASYPDTERGYAEGLRSFMRAVDKGITGNGALESELMVGSLQHSYAGRFDLVLTLSKPVEVVTKVYPKKKPRIEEIPAGRYLLDLKTSKRVYETHYLQLEAYEAAAVECGYAPTDYRGVVHVTADGKYELALNKDWTFEDFLSVRQCYQTMHERSIVQALRDELDATDVTK